MKNYQYPNLTRLEALERALTEIKRLDKRLKEAISFEKSDKHGGGAKFAAVKRSALDVKSELTVLTQGTDFKRNSNRVDYIPTTQKIYKLEGKNIIKLEEVLTTDKVKMLALGNDRTVFVRQERFNYELFHHTYSDAESELYVIEGITEEIPAPSWLDVSKALNELIPEAVIINNIVRGQIVIEFMIPYGHYDTEEKHDNLIKSIREVIGNENISSTNTEDTGNWFFVYLKK